MDFAFLPSGLSLLHLSTQYGKSVLLTLFLFLMEYILNYQIILILKESYLKGKKSIQD